MDGLESFSGGDGLKHKKGQQKQAFLSSYSEKKKNKKTQLSVRSNIYFESHLDKHVIFEIFF